MEENEIILNGETYILKDSNGAVQCAICYDDLVEVLKVLENKAVKIEEKTEVTIEDLKIIINEAVKIELEELKEFLTKSEKCSYEDLTAFELWQNLYEEIEEKLKVVRNEK